MLIKFKVQRKLPISLVRHICLRVDEEFSKVLFQQKSTTENSHNLHDGTTKFKVMFNDSYNAIGDDGNMDLYAYSILGFTQKCLKLQMLFYPF